jgi:lysozyme
MDMERLISDLERDEGIRLHPYRDTKGILTIGIGRNLDDVGISKGEAYTMLHNDLERVIVDLDQYIPWWKKLNDTRQRVLANMCFNMGITRLLGFHQMLAATALEQYEKAAEEMRISLWARQVGPRATRLAEQMRVGYVT